MFLGRTLTLLCVAWLLRHKCYFPRIYRPLKKGVRYSPTFLYMLINLYLCYEIEFKFGISFKISTYVKGSSVNLESFGGHWGQKIIFTQGVITRPFTELNHKTHTGWSIWDHIPMLWGQMSIWSQLGSLRPKVHFHQNFYNSCMLHSMTIRLTHVDQLATVYLFYGVNCQPGVIAVKFWFQQKICLNVARH